MTLNHSLGLRSGARSRCPLCDARRGLAVWDGSNYGDGSGHFYCFACGLYGSGVTFLIEARSMTRAEASRALGLSPQMASVDLDRERQRAAWARLEKRKTDSTMEACRDLVYLRESMTRTERTDWRRHGALPHRLRRSEQARRQALRVADYISAEAYLKAAGEVAT